MARKKVIDLDTYSKLDAHCIALNEFYKSLRKAGFSVELALAMIIEPSSYPGWIMPDTLPTEIDPFDYDDEDEG